MKRSITLLMSLFLAIGTMWAQALEFTFAKVSASEATVMVAGDEVEVGGITATITSNQSWKDLSANSEAFPTASILCPDKNTNQMSAGNEGVITLTLNNVPEGYSFKNVTFTSVALNGAGAFQMDNANAQHVNFVLSRGETVLGTVENVAIKVNSAEGESVVVPFDVEEAYVPENGTLELKLTLSVNESKGCFYGLVKVAIETVVEESTPEPTPDPEYPADVTAQYLTNAGFDDASSWVTEGNVDKAAKDVANWTVTTTGDSWYYGAALGYGSAAMVNNVAAPATNPEGVAEGGALGISVGWGCIVEYTQNVVLPAGVYTVTYKAINVNDAATQASNLIGFKTADASYYGKNTVFAANTWVEESVTFVLEEETAGAISVGIGAISGGSGANAKLFIDGVTISYDPEIPSGGLVVGDVTDQFLENARFEQPSAQVGGAINTPPGWTLKHETSGWLDGSTRASTNPGGDGSQCYNLWAGTVNLADIYQTVTLPAGKYKLTVGLYSDGDAERYAYATVGGNTIKSARPQHGSWDFVSVEFSNPTEGEVTMGAVSKGWFQIDNVKLEYLGEVGKDDFVNAYNQALDEAQALVGQKMSAAAAAQLEAAIAQHGSLTADNSTEELEAATDAILAELVSVKASVNSYKVLAAGALPDNSLEGWTCTNSNTFHINTWSGEGNSDGTNMVTPFIENWVGKESLLGNGKISYTLPGVDPGYYKVSSLIRVYSEANNDIAGASFFANEVKADFATGKPFTYNNMKGVYDVYTAVVNVGEEGVLEFGVEIENATFNWVAFKNVKIEYIGVIDQAAAEVLKSKIPTTKYDAALTAEIEALVAAIDAGVTYENYLALSEKVALAESSAAAYAANKTAIDGMFTLLSSTNVYTVEAYNAYKAKAEDFLTQYDAGTLNATVDNPVAIHGWHATADYCEVLLSAFGIAVDDWANLHINTWSTEGETDGSDFKVPFYEYWTGDGESLGVATKTATITGLTPGMYYTVEAWVRVRAKNGVAATDATGITLSVGNGEAVDLTEGEVIGTSQFSHAIYKANGPADAEGTLTINFNVLEGNNVSWLSFKNIKYVENPEADPSNYTSAIVNANLSTGDAWNTEGTKGISGGMVKVASESAFDFSQTITLPAGQYKMTAKAVYRYTGSEAEEFAAIEAGTKTRLVNLYAETATYKYEAGVMNRYDGASDTDYAAGNGSVSVNGKFVPNSSAAVQTWFDNGQYVNELVFNVQEEGQIKIGLTRTGSIAGDYTNIGAWTLTRLGDAEADPVVEPEYLTVVGAKVGDVAIVEGVATVESISTIDVIFDRPVALAENAGRATLADSYGPTNLEAEVLEAEEGSSEYVVRFTVSQEFNGEFTAAGEYELNIPEGFIVGAEGANFINAEIAAVITIEAAPVTPLVVTNVTVGEDVMEGFSVVASTEDMIKVNFDGEFYFQGTPSIVDAEGNDASEHFEYMNGRDLDGSNSYILMGKTVGTYTITLAKASFMQMMSFKAPAEDIVLTVEITVPDGIQNINVDADAVIYDIHGRRVTEMTKGLYIVNGKKVIVK